MPSRPDDRVEGDRRLAEHATALADAVESVLAIWVRRCVTDRCRQSATIVTPALAEATERAAQRCVRDEGRRVRSLLDLDLDEQRDTPLAVLRSAVRHPTEVLLAAGVPAVRRDGYQEEAFPEDVYDLTPRSWSDIDASLHEPGLRWGAAKAYVHLARRRET